MMNNKIWNWVRYEINVNYVKANYTNIKINKSTNHVFKKEYFLWKKNCYEKYAIHKRGDNLSDSGASFVYGKPYVWWKHKEINYKYFRRRRFYNK